MPDEAENRLNQGLEINSELFWNNLKIISELFEELQYSHQKSQQYDGNQQYCFDLDNFQQAYAVDKLIKLIQNQYFQPIQTYLHVSQTVDSSIYSNYQ